MYEKHCRYCQARISSNKNWSDNYCCDDHRVLFQERQHQETIERLRRDEGDRSESELAIHTFEPRRVRVAMLGGSDPGPVAPPSGPGTGRSIGTPSLRGMPPPFRVQPLVAPPLQPKASVEQALSALASIAEPVSAPLEIPMGYANASPVAPVALGAAVRRPVQPEPRQREYRKNDALVNLIRGAKHKIPTPDPPAYLQSPETPAIAADILQETKVSNSARVRPATRLTTEAPALNPPSTQSLKLTQAERKMMLRNATPIPKFLQAEAAAPTENWKRKGLMFSLLALTLSGAVAYFVFAGRAVPTPETQSPPTSHSAPAKSPAPVKSASRVR